ncbi:MAG: hypothetical protein Q7S24_01325 [bacterium]|nr:hypothetical protein [bacterium]
MARWILVIVMMWIFLPASVRAFSVSPLSYKTSIDPGKEGSVWIDIINDEKIAVTFKIGVTGASQNNWGQPIFKNNTDIAEGWTVVETKEILIKGGEKERVVFNIQIPKNASPGYHYLGLFAEPSVSTENISVKGRLLVVLTLQVSGVANEKVIIQNWGEQKNILFSKDLIFDLGILNNGNVSVPLKITATLINNKNETVERKVIIAGTDLMAGQDRMLTVDFSNNKLNPGKYWAEAQVVYGLTNQISRQSKSFWFLPENTKYYLFGIIGVVFVFVALLYFLKKKNYAHDQ